MLELWGIMKKPFISIIVVILSGCLNISFAQDPLFSQFFSTKYNTNPAFAGTSNTTEIAGAYRSQWSTINNAFETNYFSFGTSLSSINSGVGVTVMQDKIADGIFKSNYVSLIYAYQLQLSRKLNFSFGVKPTYSEQVFDWGRASWGDQIDATRGFVYTTNQTVNNNTIKAFDFSSGGLLYGKNFYAGLTVDHLFSTNVGYLSAEKTPLKYTVSIGGSFSKRSLYQDDVKISPNFIYQQQGNHKYVNIGLYTEFKNFVLGTWMRNRNAIILLTGVKYKKMRIGYSVDIPLTTIISAAPYGSHEITLTVSLPKKTRSPRFRTISCPVF